MSSYASMTKEQLATEKANLQKQYNAFKELGVKLDMSRGKPSVEQIALSMEMLRCLTPEEILKAGNYGILDGIPAAKKFFADLLEVQPENIIVGGNSSLQLMYDTIARAMQFGIMGNQPWSKQEKVKFLCPVPGYDRHFAITELMNIEMVNIPMNDNGPDMDQVEKMVNTDASVKGIWCVPKYSNPTGITYSDDVVRRFAALKPAAPDFRIFWDNAYVVHHLGDEQDELLNIFEECKKHNNQDMVYEFCSTSKITFPGAGVAAMAASEPNIKWILKLLTVQTIGYDKLNQIRHCKYLKSQEFLAEHMKKHAASIRPKFAIVLDYLDREIAPLEIANWTKPKGGYFISFNTMNGCAKRVGELCKQAGVTLTGVGATFPYGIDVNDANIRIAPTFPPVEELEQAMQLFCICVKLASVEKLMEE